MGTSYFSSAKDRREYEARMKKQANQRAAHLEGELRKIAAKVVMAVVDKIIADIVRPGPMPEERECYEMAGEVRALVPELEDLTVQIIGLGPYTETPEYKQFMEQLRRK